MFRQLTVTRVDGYRNWVKIILHWPLNVWEIGFMKINYDYLKKLLETFASSDKAVIDYNAYIQLISAIENKRKKEGQLI